MSHTVTEAFIQLYTSEVKAAYQREGSLLRNTIRNRTNIGAERVYFPTLGKGRATQKARHADVVPMGLEHSKAYADMEDLYAPEYVDDLDQAKVNWTIRSEYAKASAWALGRATDDIIFDALDGTTNTTDISTLGGAAKINLKAVTAASEALNSADVPADNMRYAVISPSGLSDILAIPGATSSDFVREQLLVTGKAPAFWLGFNWIVHTGLPAGTKAFFYHPTAAGLGIASDVKASIDWVPQKVAHLVNAWMSMGATVIDPAGVLKVED